jgi:UDP-N-acetylmuramate dehydrogenase
MVQINENASLKKLNTFGIEASAHYLAAFSSVDELHELLAYRKERNLPMMVLGGGSNILLTKDVDALVIKNEMKGIRLVSETDSHFIVEAAAGEVWHHFVMECIKKEYAGVENLALIPGCVGAGPMQNIGAYGVELKDVFQSLEAIHVETGELKTFSLEECTFGYRESIFKRKEKGNWVITSVQFRLRKRPVYQTNYGAIEAELDKMNLEKMSIKAVAQAVINIRSSKLPDPAKIGNAGSFFKNPVVPMELVKQIQTNYASVPVFPIDETQAKVPAGWLIEQAGWKGKNLGTHGVHALQALVLVNYGGATGSEIWNLSEAIVKDVHQKFGVELEREVNII